MEENDSVMTPEQEAWVQTVFHEAQGYLKQKGIPFNVFEGAIGFDYNGNHYALQKLDGDFMFELVHVLEWSFLKGKKNFIDLFEITNLIHSEFDMVRMVVAVEDKENSEVIFYSIQNVVYPGANIADLMEYSLEQLDSAIDVSKQLIRCKLDEMERFSQILYEKLQLTNAEEKADDQQSKDEDHLQNLINLNHKKYQA